MRLLMTRPAEQARRSAERFKAAGHTVLIAPLMVAEALPPPSFLPKAGAVLLSSAHAAHSIAAWPPTLLARDIPLLAVGARTAEAAREAGFLDVRSAEGDGAALAALAARTLDPAAGPLLYPTLAEPARDLHALLAPRGFTVVRIEAYRIVAAERLPEAAVTEIKAGSIDGVLLYSRRSSEIFLRLAASLGPYLAALRYYCLSADIAGIIAGGAVVVAAEPNETSLLAAVTEPLQERAD